MTLHANPALLACPKTRLPVRECPLEEAASLIGGGSGLRTRQGEAIDPTGATRTVLVRSDNACAFPVVDGIPILLAPEMLLAQGQPHEATTDPKYAEAYDEMDFYNEEARRALRTAHLPSEHRLELALRATREQQESFPAPKEVWVDSVYDFLSQWEAYEHLAPVTGKRVLQIGGKGTHAIRFLCAGASEAWLITPTFSELVFGVALAKTCGVADRFYCVGGVAEEMPVVDELFDGAYSGSSLHHSITSLSFAEVFRVLRPGGRLAAVEPWEAPFYRLGTRILGKREAVISLPLTKERAKPLFEIFQDARIIHHGALSRYPLVALSKLGVSLTQGTAARITRLDDALSDLAPPLRRLGSSSVLLATREKRPGEPRIA